MCVGFNKVLLVLYRLLIGLFTSKKSPCNLPKSIPKSYEKCPKKISKKTPKKYPKKNLKKMGKKNVEQKVGLAAVSYEKKQLQKKMCCVFNDFVICCENIFS